MAGPDEDTPSPFAPLLADLARMRRSNLTTAIDDVDRILDLLAGTRDQVARGTRQPVPAFASLPRVDPLPDFDAHRTGMAMTALQSPVKAQLEAINTHLKDVTKSQKAYGKALDKVRAALFLGPSRRRSRP